MVEPEKAWDVATLAPGDWRYEKQLTGSVAQYGPPAGPRIALLRCDSATRQITLSIDGVGASGASVPVVIRTTSGTLAWSGVGNAAADQFVAITRPATDPGFNWIAYSRGRISVEPQGKARLILPVWAEIARVIEDCRG
ncbi:MAG TPA: hypothetical protein VGE65_08770 [Sphingobium sp.]